MPNRKPRTKSKSFLTKVAEFTEKHPAVKAGSAAIVIFGLGVGFSDWIQTNIRERDSYKKGYLEQSAARLSAENKLADQSTPRGLIVSASGGVRQLGAGQHAFKFLIEAYTTKDAGTVDLSSFRDGVVPPVWTKINQQKAETTSQNGSIGTYSVPSLEVSIDPNIRAVVFVFTVTEEECDHPGRLHLTEPQFIVCRQASNWQCTNSELRFGGEKVKMNVQVDQIKVTSAITSR